MQMTTSIDSGQMTLLLPVFGIVHVDVQRSFMLHRDERVTTAQPNHQQPLEKLKQPASRLDPERSSFCQGIIHLNMWPPRVALGRAHRRQLDADEPLPTPQAESLNTNPRNPGKIRTPASPSHRLHSSRINHLTSSTASTHVPVPSDLQPAAASPRPPRPSPHPPRLARGNETDGSSGLTR